jgi:hypothetical protein
VPLPLCDLDPENALQSPLKRRRDPDAFVQSLDPLLEIPGGDVAVLRAASALRVVPDAAEVAEAVLDERVVEP